MIMKILKRNDLYENFEKRGGSREKGGGGNEIHAPCACGSNELFTEYTLTIKQHKSRTKLQTKIS